MLGGVVALSVFIKTVAAIALGYFGEPQTLPEKLQQRENAPRIRKPLEELVFSGSWNQTSPLVPSQKE